MEMLGLFQPKGAKPQWEIIYDAVKDYPVGTGFDYDQLDAMTGLKIQGEHRGYLYRANTHLLRDYQKMLVNIKGVGYRLGYPPEQVAHAHGRRKRSARQLDKGIMELTNLDTSKMSNDEKTNVVHMINHFQMSLTVVRKHNVEALNLQTKTIHKQETILREIDNTIEQLAEFKKHLA